MMYLLPTSPAGKKTTRKRVVMRMRRVISRTGMVCNALSGTARVL